MASSAKRVRRSRAQWQELIERGERSPLGILGFCRAEGISSASFYSWRQRLGQAPVTAPTGAEPAFVDLGTLGEAATTGGWEMELDLGAGVVLRLRRR